jgi:preprotein translocase subunit SecD
MEQEKTVIRSRSKGILKETEQIFTDMDRHAHDLQNNAQRYPEGDQTLDGQPCKTYILKKSDPSNPSLKNDNLRQLFYDITGDYLNDAKLEFTIAGKPAMSFSFNTAGGKLLEKLTGDHLPNNSTGLCYSLGIIIDGELFSAPTIRSKIGNNGEITGSFTEIEVLDMAAALNARSLPAQFRPVVETPHSN